MESELWSNINYLANISYINNAFIYELDISKANINVLKSKGILDDNTYNFLYKLEHDMRYRYIGKMIQKNPSIQKILTDGIIEAKQWLFSSNNIQDREVLSIKNDAVFIIGREPKYKEFNNLVRFITKGVFTGFYRVGKLLEFYYFYNKSNKQEQITIKGIDDNKWLSSHNDYMINLFKDIFYTLQCNSIEEAINKLKIFYFNYINLELPIGFYREFDSNSNFKFKDFPYVINNITDEYKPYLDITCNINLIIELQKILFNIYFNKHK